MVNSVVVWCNAEKSIISSVYYTSIDVVLECEFIINMMEQDCGFCSD